MRAEKRQSERDKTEKTTKREGIDGRKNERIKKNKSRCKQNNTKATTRKRRDKRTRSLRPKRDTLRSPPLWQLPPRFWRSRSATTSTSGSTSEEASVSRRRRRWNARSLRIFDSGDEGSPPTTAPLRQAWSPEKRKKKATFFVNFFFLVLFLFCFHLIFLCWQKKNTIHQREGRKDKDKEREQITQ